MPTITEQKIINGVLADGVSIQRNVASAISLLKAQTDLMAEAAAYLLTNPDGVVDSEYVAKVTSEFQEQLQPLLTDILPKLQAIESIGSSTNGPANLAAMISAYNLSPATFSYCYK